jgi:hypothetical protein
MITILAFRSSEARDIPLQRCDDREMRRFFKTMMRRDEELHQTKRRMFARRQNRNAVQVVIEGAKEAKEEARHPLLRQL